MAKRPVPPKKVQRPRRKRLGRKKAKPNSSTAKPSPTKKVANVKSKRNTPQQARKKSVRRSRTPEAKKKPKTVKADKKPPSLSRLFWEFRRALRDAEQCSYFDLSPETRSALAPFEDPKSGLPLIKKWSFTVHPNIVRELGHQTGSLRRYIVAIDTRTSSIYFPVKKYLEDYGNNVTTYYSGGWADFLCDVQLNETYFRKFIEDLKKVLTDNGLRKIERDVNNVLSIFEVGHPLVVCGRRIGSFPTPATSALELIKQDPVRFDIVREDYRSTKARSLFKNPKELRSYLDRLKAANIIVCFRIVFDFSYWISRDYVPMNFLGERGSAEITMEELLANADRKRELLEPVEELLQIEDVISNDRAEREVKYFFINSYDYPGARDDWKRAIYDAANVDVNLYNYPLEGTLNESPVYLSELPQLVGKANQYQVGDETLTIGDFNHELLSEPIQIGLVRSGLARHGITLGAAGSGKTTTDLVLTNAASKVLDKVIILDASRGVRGKLDALPDDVRQRIQTISIDAANIGNEFRNLLNERGFFFFEVRESDVADAFSTLLDEFAALDDAGPGDQEREIRNLLLVEEAASVLGQTGKRRENLDRLLPFLEQSYRRGWSLWLSVQRLSLITDEVDVAAQLLRPLKNRIIHRQISEIDTLVEVFKTEKPWSPADTDYFSSTVSELRSGEAFLRGIELTPTERYLPLIKIQCFQLKSLK